MVFSKPFDTGDFLQISLHSVTPKIGSNLEDIENQYRMYEGYEPAIIVNDWVFWTSHSFGNISNSTTIEFPKSTGNPGPVNSFSIASESGLILFVGPITNPIWVPNGTTLEFAPGHLGVSLAK